MNRDEIRARIRDGKSVLGDSIDKDSIREDILSAIEVFQENVKNESESISIDKVSSIVDYLESALNKLS